jgi:hypothetical protein
MFYRYQQSLIDEAITTLAALLQRPPSPAASQKPIDRGDHKNKTIYEALHGMPR